MAARSTLTLKIEGEQAPPAPFLDQVRHLAKSVDLNLIAGTADNQMQKLLALDASMVASGTKTVDLQTDLDRYGAALAATDSVLVFIEHKSTSLASAITIAAAGTNGWTNLLSATAALTLRPGDFMLVGSLKAGNLAVSSVNKALLLTNLDGVNAADYVVSVWVR